MIGALRIVRSWSHRGTNETWTVQHIRRGIHADHTTCHRSCAKTSENHCQMRWHRCINTVNTLLRKGYVWNQQSVHECQSFHLSNKPAEVHPCLFWNWAGCWTLICLPAAHAISGCDTTSSLFKIGKRTAYSTLPSNIEDLISLAHLGQSGDISNELPTAKEYALLLYGSKGKSCKLLTSFGATTHVKVTRPYHSSRLQMLHSNNMWTTRSRYGPKAMRQSLLYGDRMAMNGR